MMLELRGLELHGAYGRKTVMKDWTDGKDFKIVGGPYCSIRDLDKIKADGFDILEFIQNGQLVERIFLNEALDKFVETSSGTFKRVP